MAYHLKINRELQSKMSLGNDIMLSLENIRHLVYSEWILMIGHKLLLYSFHEDPFQTYCFMFSSDRAI